MRKLKQLLLVALVFALTACGTSQTTEVAPQSLTFPPSPPAAVSVIAKAEAPLDVRDDEVVWGASEEAVELASEAEGVELGEPTADLNAEEAEVVSESNDISPAVISAAPAEEERSGPRRSSEVGEGVPAPTGDTEGNDRSEAETAASASPASPSGTGLGNLVGEGNAPAVAENGSYYGEVSPATGRPKTVHVRGYHRKDGTYVRGHYRSTPRRRN